MFSRKSGVNVEKIVTNKSASNKTSPLGPQLYRTSTISTMGATNYYSETAELLSIFNVSNIDAVKGIKVERIPCHERNHQLTNNHLNKDNILSRSYLYSTSTSYKMKFTTTILAALFSLIAVSAASPTGFTPVDNVLETRKGCSGDRTEDDVCGGKKLQIQNSFHNW